jgi:hypothetical protein
LWIHEKNVDEYARAGGDDSPLGIARSCGDDSDLVMPVQLTHSGRYSVPDRTIAYHNPLIDQKTGTARDVPAISDDELDRLQDQFGSGEACRTGGLPRHRHESDARLSAQRIDGREDAGGSLRGADRESLAVRVRSVAAIAR